MRLITLFALKRKKKLAKGVFVSCGAPTKKDIADLSRAVAAQSKKICRHMLYEAQQMEEMSRGIDDMTQALNFILAEIKKPGPDNEAGFEHLESRMDQLASHLVAISNRIIRETTARHLYPMSTALQIQSDNANKEQ